MQKSMMWPLALWATLTLHACLSGALSIKKPGRPTLQNNLHHQNIVNIKPFVGTGITSILPVPKRKDEIYVGTKRGKVRKVKLPTDLRDATSIEVHDVEDANGRPLKPYPIFSMMTIPKDGGNSHDSNHDLLAGGGDRFATVWRESNNQQSHSSDDEIMRSWEVVEQLGPHTGWVKDLASCTWKSNSIQPDSSHMENGRFIFSIGCNYIEVWSALGGRYRNEHKLNIESSVEMGCTLSSDILCLANHVEHGANGDITNYLFAGGVDGRIHRWAIHNSNKFASSATGVISAHDGRVNAIVVCQAMDMLVSVGNDGYIHCWAINNPYPTNWEVTSLELVDDYDGVSEIEDSSPRTKRKITSLCILQEESNRAVIAVGTSCGRLALVDIIKSDANTLNASFVNDGKVSITGLNDDGKGNVIHALCSRRYDIFSRMAIGHSNGLSVWDLPTVDHMKFLEMNE